MMNPVQRKRNDGKSKRKHRRKKRLRRKRSENNPGYGNMTKEVSGDQVLEDLTGLAQATRPQYVRLLWQYIKRENLQLKTDGRVIIPDERFARLMGQVGVAINAFRMTKYIEEHLLKK